MKFTLAWLKRHLDTDATANQIIDNLVNIGWEIEELVDKGKIYEPFLIAQIEEAIPHPNAEKLKICTVNNGKEKLQIVCGAENARAGLKVVLAPVGAIIPANGMIIKISKIRGIESFGMLCSASELNLEFGEEGIIELPVDAPIGSNFADFARLNDVVIDIALTPNRGDASSVYGIARDLVATEIGKLKLPEMKGLKSSVESKVKVTIEDKEGCQEFLGRYIEGTKNLTSKGEIYEYLRAIGSTFKNQLVDISNFAMFEYGRPNHIYDADKIDGNIIVRKAIKGEQFLALDGKEYILDDDIMVVADNSKVLAVAGVIGGELSKVDENTKNIFLEVANFNPIFIAQAGRKLNVNTDSRYRFERRVDYLNSEFVVNYISQLIIDQCGGNCSDIISSVGNKLKYLEEVEFSPDSIGKLAGFKIDSEECKKILNNLQFELSSINNKVKIPSYRQGDILGEADLIEEVLRIYGYNKIPSLPFKVPVNELKSNDNELNEKIRGRLTTRGINEVITWSFMEKKVTQELGFVDLIKLKNPISLELEVMRPTVILNLLNLVVKNISRGFVNIGFFEIGPVYNNTYHDKQIECISGVRVGNIFDKGVHKEERQVDFFDVKADIFSILEEVNFNPENLTVNKLSSQYYHPGRSAVFKLGNQIIAYGGEIHPALLKKLDINEPVVGFELFIDNLPVIKVKNAKNKLDLSNLQSVTRDFAFIVDQKIEAQSLQKAIRLLNKDVIEQVTIFDVYTGKGVEEGKKSIALSVKLQPKEQTFSEAQIDEVSNNIINHLTIKFEAKLR